MTPRTRSDAVSGIAVGKIAAILVAALLAWVGCQDRRVSGGGGRNPTAESPPPGVKLRDAADALCLRAGRWRYEKSIMYQRWPGDDGPVTGIYQGHLFLNGWRLPPCRGMALLTFLGTFAPGSEDDDTPFLGWSDMEGEGRWLEPDPGVFLEPYQEFLRPDGIYEVPRRYFPAYAPCGYVVCYPWSATPSAEGEQTGWESFFIVPEERLFGFLAERSRAEETRDPLGPNGLALSPEQPCQNVGQWRFAKSLVYFPFHQAGGGARSIVSDLFLNEGMVRPDTPMAVVTPLGTFAGWHGIDDAGMGGWSDTIGGGIVLDVRAEADMSPYQAYLGKDGLYEVPRSLYPPVVQCGYTVCYQLGPARRFDPDYKEWDHFFIVPDDQLSNFLSSHRYPEEVPVDPLNP